MATQKQRELAQQADRILAKGQRFRSQKCAQCGKKAKGGPVITRPGTTKTFAFCCNDHLNQWKHANPTHPAVKAMRDTPA